MNRKWWNMKCRKTRLVCKKERIRCKSMKWCLAANNRRTELIRVESERIVTGPVSLFAIESGGEVMEIREIYGQEGFS